jgi:hypothetical protein
MATTSTLGSAWLISARRCSGKVPNVSSPPWTVACQRHHCHVHVDGEVVRAYLEAMKEHEQEGFAHAHQLPSMMATSECFHRGHPGSKCAALDAGCDQP